METMFNTKRIKLFVTKKRPCYETFHKIRCFNQGGASCRFVVRGLEEVEVVSNSVCLSDNNSSSSSQ